MAFDAVLIFPPGNGSTPTIKGESTDAYFTGQDFSGAGVIQISSFTFGSHNTIVVNRRASGVGAGRAAFNEFKVTKLVDRSSPTLFRASAAGQHFPVVQLYLRKAGKDPKAVYLAYEFQIVFISAIDWSGSSGDEAPVEDVTFVYGGLVVAYHPQNQDGTLDTAVTGSWNQVTNSGNLPQPPSLVGF